MEKSDSQDGPDGMQMLAYWIKIARVQGQTYEKLFSPAAFLRSSEERTQIAIELVNSMNQAWYERGDAAVTDFTALGQSGAHGEAFTTNTNPNDTELPSKRKLRNQPNEYINGR